MRMTGPFSDDTWDWLPQSREADQSPHAAASSNDAKHIIWELGVVLLVPLAGAGLVELVLNAFSVS